MKEHIQAKNIDLLRQTLPFLRAYRGKILISMACIMPIAFLQGTQPYLLKLALDKTALSKPILTQLSFIQKIGAQANPISIAVALGISILFLFVFRLLQNAIVQEVGQCLITDIRFKLFTHLQSLSIDFFEKNQAGKLLTRLTSDIEALSETFSSGLIGGLNDLFSLLGIAIFMFYLDWRLSLAQVLLVPFLAILTKNF